VTRGPKYDIVVALVCLFVCDKLICCFADSETRNLKFTHRIRTTVLKIEIHFAYLEPSSKQLIVVG